MRILGSNRSCYWSTISMAMQYDDVVQLLSCLMSCTGRSPLIAFFQCNCRCRNTTKSPMRNSSSNPVHLNVMFVFCFVLAVTSGLGGTYRCFQGSGTFPMPIRFYTMVVGMKIACVRLLLFSDEKAIPVQRARQIIVG